MWIFEELYPDLKIGIEGKLLYKTKSKFQNLKVFDTNRFGKLLLLDGAIQTTERDEFIYHEMLTHPLLLAHPNPKNILIIGAGDGGILRETLKHPVSKVTLVELDEEVINITKKHLPSICKNAFKNKKVKIVIDDGAKFVSQTREKYDIIIIDSPDPIGPAKILFSSNFYKDVYNALTASGIIIRQTGSSFAQESERLDNIKKLKAIFPIVETEIITVPTYIGGFFTLLVASKKINPKTVPYKNISQKYESLRLNTKYYNPDIHFAAFALPNYIKREKK
ncbi:MAG: polyamine aminopropyltransferase [Candidatus Omnitrophica bacterium]|nr:polyamine aminopropyltransferase [Candidatus Omnitrophota bacterium]MDD5080676.1 polyamine aminopropyltransferase [Candidatus Omnitrophota bacterium]MDD5440667.1 polyamine aminopropyltransferase [Candidatus Omnitrophota bacterium]